MEKNGQISEAVPWSLANREAVRGKKQRENKPSLCLRELRRRVPWRERKG